MRCGENLIITVADQEPYRRLDFPLIFILLSSMLLVVQVVLCQSRLSIENARFDRYNGHLDHPLPQAP